MAIRVAIIGCGGMARGHLNAYLGIQEVVPDKVELVAMCDPVRKNAEDFASRVKDATGKMPVVYENTDAMLAAEDLDGADICTPPPLLPSHQRHQVPKRRSQCHCREVHRHYD